MKRMHIVLFFLIVAWCFSIAPSVNGAESTIRKVLLEVPVSPMG